MKEIIIQKNESQQRLDRFLQKYLNKAPRSFIFKMIRKKNIKVNGKRVEPNIMLNEGDRIQLFLADETIENFREEKKVIKSKIAPNIIYEDDNILLINKEVGILSHGAGGSFEENVVDSIIQYLIEKGEYVPRIERTFTPSICNRLDRNTSGLIIGAKNYDSLKLVNEAMKKGHIRKFYKTIVKGRVEREMREVAYLAKDEDRNLVEVMEEDMEGAKKIVTNITPLKYSKGYTLLEIELITGRTHQIRSHLSALGFPIIGDRKYGRKAVNESFRKQYGLDNQWLHAYKLEFNGLEAPLDYLNGRVFTAQASRKFLNIEKDLFS